MNPKAQPQGPRCPFCGSHATERLSLFGSQLLTEQYYCTACHTPFEHVRDEPSAADPLSLEPEGEDGDEGAFAARET
jgi:transposase-like protein